MHGFFFLHSKMIHLRLEGAKIAYEPLGLRKKLLFFKTILEST